MRPKSSTQYLLLALIAFSLLPYASNATDKRQRPQQQQSGLMWVEQAMAALTGGNPVNSVTESGSITWSFGQNQGTGTISLQSTGNTNSQIALTTSAGNRSETRSWASDGSGPVGQWTDLNGNPHQMVQHNCWSDAVWFFPALSMLSDYSDPTIVYNDLGPEQYDGHDVEHIQAYRSFLPDISVVDYYLDSQTAIPWAMRFALRDERDLTLKVPVDVVFSEYQTVDGIQTPLQVMQNHNGSATYEITLSSVQVN